MWLRISVPGVYWPLGGGQGSEKLEVVARLTRKMRGKEAQEDQEFKYPLVCQAHQPLTSWNSQVPLERCASQDLTSASDE
jgi:hypothetical protein